MASKFNGDWAGCEAGGERWDDEAEVWGWYQCGVAKASASMWNDDCGVTLARCKTQDGPSVDGKQATMQSILKEMR